MFPNRRIFLKTLWIIPMSQNHRTDLNTAAAHGRQRDEYELV